MIKEVCRATRRAVDGEGVLAGMPVYLFLSPGGTWQLTATRRPTSIAAK